MFFHVTNLNRKTFFNKVMTTPAEICTHLVTRGLLLGYDQYQVNRREFMNLNYKWKGNSYANTSSKVKCTWAKIVLENMLISNEVIHVENNIWTEHDEFVWTNGMLHSSLLGAKLPCHVDYQQCETLDCTFVWENREEDKYTVQST